jgi:hypothetical protein
LGRSTLGHAIIFYLAYKRKFALIGAYLLVMTALALVSSNWNWATLPNPVRAYVNAGIGVDTLLTFLVIIVPGVFYFCVLNYWFTTPRRSDNGGVAK